MGRIIDADAFYQQEWIRCGMYEPMIGVDKVDSNKETLYRTLRSRLNKVPEVDAIKVVRCKDCNLWDTWDKQGESCSCAHFTLDDSNAVYTKPEDFCSYAIRGYYWERNRRKLCGMSTSDARNVVESLALLTEGNI